MKASLQWLLQASGSSYLYFPACAKREPNIPWNAFLGSLLFVLVAWDPGLSWVQVCYDQNLSHSKLDKYTNSADPMTMQLNHAASEIAFQVFIWSWVFVAFFILVRHCRPHLPIYKYLTSYLTIFQWTDCCVWPEYDGGGGRVGLQTDEHFFGAVDQRIRWAEGRDYVTCIITLHNIAEFQADPLFKTYLYLSDCSSIVCFCFIARMCPPLVCLWAVLLAFVLPITF